MNISLENPIRPTQSLKHVYPHARNWLPYVLAPLLSAATLVILASCQPQVIELDKPVTRLVEKPVEVVVTRVVEQPVEVVVTRLVEKPVEVVVTRLVTRSHPPGRETG